MLKCNEADFTEFFGVVSKADTDDEFSFCFESSRDGLRLLVTLFCLEGSVCVSLFRDGLPGPLITVSRDFCSHAHIVEKGNSRRCFEAGSTKIPVTNMGIPPILERGIRVFVEPQFQLELIERRFEVA